MRFRTILAFTVLLLLIPVLALAGIPSPTEDLGAFAGGLLDAVGNSEWRIVGALVLMGLVALTRRYGTRFGLGSGRAAFVTAVALGAALSVSGGLASGVAMGGIIGVLKLIINGAITGFAASGIYSGVKKLSETA